MSTVPISNDLVPIYNQLSALKRDCIQFQTSTIKDMHQLHHYQTILLSIETKFKLNGIWCGSLTDGIIPIGQATLNELFDECHDIIDEIQLQLPEYIENESHPIVGGKIEKMKLQLNNTNTTKCDDSCVGSIDHSHHTNGGLVDQAKEKLTSSTCISSDPKVQHDSTGHPHHIDGGLIDQAKTKLIPTTLMEQPIVTGHRHHQDSDLITTGHPHHTDGGLVDHAKMNLDHFAKPQDEVVGINESVSRKKDIEA